MEKNKGIVKNDGMIRVDLYSKDGKYFGVPVYVADLYRGELPKEQQRPINRKTNGAKWTTRTRSKCRFIRTTYYALKARKASNLKKIGTMNLVQRKIVFC